MVLNFWKATLWMLIMEPWDLLVVSGNEGTDRLTEISGIFSGGYKEPATRIHCNTYRSLVMFPAHQGRGRV